MKFVLKHFVFALVLCASFLNAQAQGLTALQIDSLVERTLKAFQVPGIAVGVIKDGKLIHAKGYGVRSLNNPQPVDENTLFGIASNSKAFTAAAIGKLVDAGKLKWDDKVRDYIPEFKLSDPYVTEDFRIRDLLTHRCGLGLGAGDLMFFPDSANFNVQNAIFNLRYLKPESAFRTKFQYNNLMFITAGEIVARVSGESWFSFIENNFFKPLGMSQSSAQYNRLSNKSNIIEPHAICDGKLMTISHHNSELMSAAGTIFSNVTDISKWLIALMNNAHYGENNAQTLFSQKVLNEMMGMQMSIPVSNPGTYNTHFSGYGLGFFLKDVKGYKEVSHSGGLPGNVTQLTMIPELGLGIIVLTNQQEGGAFKAITDAIKDSYLGIKNIDRVNLYATNRNKNVNYANHLMDSIYQAVNANLKAKVKPNLVPYAGTYSDAWFGDVVFSMQNGKLIFESKKSPKLKGELFLYKNNTLLVKWYDRSFDADAWVRIKMSDEGKVLGFTMEAISPMTDFSFDFDDLEFKVK
jgi:CubicO group peptidase (beta-lactamase class C family)